MDIAEFLNRCLDADEQLAHSVIETTSSASSVADEGDYAWWELEEGGTIYAHCHVPIARSPYSGYFEGDTGRFIAAHDPARVLADIAAKRRILARHHAVKHHPHALVADACEGCGQDLRDGSYLNNIDECPELRDLATPYAEDADFDPAWRTDG